MERKLAAIFSADVKGYSRLKQAFALAQKAVALDESLLSAHQLLGQVYLFQRQHQQAMAEAERAIALAPTDADDRVGDRSGVPGRAEGVVRSLEHGRRGGGTIEIQDPVYRPLHDSIGHADGVDYGLSRKNIRGDVPYVTRVQVVKRG